MLTATLVPPTLLALWPPLRRDLDRRATLEGGVWTALSLSLVGLLLAMPFYWLAFRFVQLGAVRGGAAQRWHTYALAPCALLQQSLTLTLTLTPTLTLTLTLTLTHT